MTVRILLVGCGKMGSALLQGWAKNSSYVLSTLDPQSPDADYLSPQEIFSAYDVIVLAVKPQVMSDVCSGLKHLVKTSTLLVSIAAGKTIGFYEGLFGTAIPIVRVMPNTPALISKGMSVLYANTACSVDQKKLATDLIAAVGLCEWIDDERLMDAVTALSGSGPAYVFHLIEAMSAAGKSLGLSDTLSTTLARQTVIGAAALAEHENNISVETLRQNVTSPGGTTEAALKVLMSPDDGLTKLMTSALRSAEQRGKELAK